MTHDHVASRYHQKMYMLIFKSGHALEQIQKQNLRLGKVLDGWSIYPV